MNRNFAKIEDGKVKFAPFVLKGVEMTFVVDGVEVTDLYDVDHPTAEQYRAAGYLDVVTSPRPEDGDSYHYIDGYEVQFDDTTGRDMLYQVWKRVEDPDPEDEDISAEEALNIILGVSA